MNGAVWPLVLTVAGGVIYHVAAKSLPKDVNPALVLVGAYATALCASGIAYAVLPWAPGSPAGTRLLHPAILAVGVGAAMIELGYVLTYRAAWPVSVASVLVNTMVSILLVAAGALVFGERLTVVRGLGIALCVLGAWLLRR